MKYVNGKLVDDERELLESVPGIENVEYYGLINNYGYHFKLKGFEYDLRHWLNCYGADVDDWSLSKIGAKDNPTVIPEHKHTLEDTVRALKEI